MGSGSRLVGIRDTAAGVGCGMVGPQRPEAPYWTLSRSVAVAEDAGGASRPVRRPAARPATSNTAVNVATPMCRPGPLHPLRPWRFCYISRFGEPVTSAMSECLVWMLPQNLPKPEHIANTPGPCHRGNAPMASVG